MDGWLLYSQLLLLTLQQAEFHGVVPVSNGHFGPLQKQPFPWSARLKQAVAVCHGLTLITKLLVVGEDMERRLFKSVEARFVVGTPHLA